MQYIAQYDNFRFNLFEKLRASFVSANDVFSLIVALKINSTII